MLFSFGLNLFIFKNPINGLKSAILLFTVSFKFTLNFSYILKGGVLEYRLNLDFILNRIINMSFYLIRI